MVRALGSNRAILRGTLRQRRTVVSEVNLKHRQPVIGQRPSAGVCSVLRLLFLGHRRLVSVRSHHQALPSDQFRLNDYSAASFV